MRAPRARVEHVFGRDFLRMTARQQQYWIEQARRYWREKGFPYPVLSLAERHREFALLASVDPGSIIRRSTISHSTIGLRLANAFHPAMWHIRVHGRSPVDLFGDDDSLARALHKAAGFWPDRHCWNAQCVRSVLRIMHRVRVSNFRPAVARALLSRFSGVGEEVLDFSAGYGGRLLGALTLARTYVGIDPARAQISGLRSMVKAVSPQAVGAARVIRGCAEELLPRWPDRSFSVVFSSPPYFNRERYSDEGTQSCVRYPAYEEWKEAFLKVAIRESFRLLDRGGHLLLNVANTGNLPIASDAEEICRPLGRRKQVLRMLMAATPSHRARSSGSVYRWEPIYVFRKQ